MFGAEPLEPWTKEEAAEFEAHVSARTRMCLRRAGWATAVFAVTAVALAPLLQMPMTSSREGSLRQALLLAALAEVVWMLQRWLLVYGSWQSARATRREMGEPR